jgi:murein DD-endopeptidase MepM/ murein hydrolase activator NlpD
LPHAIRVLAAVLRRRPAAPIARHVAGHSRAIPAVIGTLALAAALVGAAPSTTGRTPDPSVVGAASSSNVRAFGGTLRVAGHAPAAASSRAPVQDTTALAITLPATRLRPIGATAPEVKPPPPGRLGPVDVRRFDESKDTVGPYRADGVRFVLSRPAARVPDGSARLRKYKSRSGDTLASVAHRFHLQAETIWWANKLDSMGRVRKGTVLTIPPLNGLVIHVKSGDTLTAVAKRAKVDPRVVIDANGLSTPTLRPGATLIVPGGRGGPLPNEKAHKKAHATAVHKPVHKAHKAVHKAHKPAHKAAKKHTSSTHASRASVGGWVFPVVGGGAYISQPFHASHPAIDIAADPGTSVRAAHRGRVTFAGWKSNGGGWQVWISHGSGLYTTYNHMQSLSVHTGQSVAKGQRVGRVGSSGLATGPHCHFEVWRGPIWDGGTRVDPLKYV